jgi:photosystem II stability/assembly factor-like uncharacterized protein
MCKIYFLFILALTSLNAQWKTVNPSNYYWSYAFAVDACDSATAAISVRGDSGGIILLTTDAGKTWQNLSWPKVGQWSSPVDISIKDAKHIWAAIDDGRIIATSDGGKTWQVQFDNKNMTVFMDYVEMFNNNEGVALGDAVSISNALFTTINGGQNWNKCESNILEWSAYDAWRMVDFINRQTGYFCTSSQLINYKTDDGGTNWIKTSLPYSSEILKFYNENYGMTVARRYINNQYNSILCITKNGGITCDSTNIGSTTAFDIEFLPGEPSKVWMSRTNGLYFSPDSGKTWVDGNLYTTVAARINDIVFVNKRIGWALSNHSPSVYRTENNAGLATDVVTKETIPTKFSLNQNYPNPFNPSTTISYQLSAFSYVTLKIYDLLGREVTTIVNEYQQAGNYNSQFSILNSQMASGIYFYSLKAGNFAETKKMALIK